MKTNFFDENYYENGPESGKSLYKNYRWMPELTIPMAMTIIDLLGIRPNQTVLDFGCAKGYLVKALRLLNRAAWGVDASQYAIQNADSCIKDYCFLNETPEDQVRKSINGFPNKFNYCIAKDVFEHIPQEQLAYILKEVINTDVLFVVVPLADNGKFRAKANEYDESHVIKEDEFWWENFLVDNGWHLRNRWMRVNGIKDSYYSTTPNAHGFFKAVRK